MALDMYGCLKMLENDSVFFLSTFKTWLEECMTQNLHDQINVSSRCCTYKHFKTLLNTEKYLTIEIPYTIRNVLARVRCSSFCILQENKINNICNHCYSLINVVVVVV